MNYVIPISADSRSELIETAQMLRRSIGDRTSVPELASQAAGKPHGPVRLAVVAENSDVLIERLDRAIDRLRDGKRSRVRDAAGIFYVDEPLYAPGKLAFLYPGEGAQSVGMLTGLDERFPVIEEIISSCEEIERHQKIANGTIRHSLVGNSKGGDVEALLADFTVSIFSVMACCWCLDSVLGTLGIRPDAMAGHSAGESSALFASQTIAGDTPLSVLQAISDIGNSQSSDSAMLAIGSSKEKVEALLGNDNLMGAGTELFLAMDNCPHQVIAVGATEAVERAESALKSANLIVQRLEIPRPYHTPLFHPFMPKLTKLFGHLEFQTPRVPLYSCTTGQLFPNDPAEIRRLAVEHWERPVEFTKLIRQMYDDGIRLFVEVGPRGNLTSFTEDILRGKPAAIVSANRAGRSADLQVAHLVAELWVHGVPMKLSAMTQREGETPAEPRTTSTPEFLAAEASASRFEAPRFKPTQFATALSQRTRARRGMRIWEAIQTRSQAVPANETQSALIKHQQVMQKFLDTQRAVMHGYLRDGEARVEPKPATHTPSPVPSCMPLAGRVIEHVPSQMLVIERPLDLAEDLYADHHTVGGQTISRVDPGQHGLPVMPMTFFLEMMAEAAKQLVPDWHVVRFEKVRLRKWLPFFANDPGSVSVRVTRVESRDATEIALQAEVTDLGTSKKALRDQLGGKAATCRITMKRAYSTEPVDDFPFDEPTQCEISFDQLYMNLFHGRLLQGVTSFDRIDAKQIECSVEVQPREGLFASETDPEFLLDPVTLDIAMHPLAAWHLSQPDQSGRIMLPFEVDELEFFDGAPAVSDSLQVHGRLTQQSARHFVHDLVAHRADGRPWFRMKGAKFWRFYLPFHQVNFHGPKDIYYLSEDWSDALPDSEALSESDALRRFSSARLSLAMLDAPQDLVQGALQDAAACVVFGDREFAEYDAIEGDVARKIAWIFNRFAAKDAVRLYRKRNLNVDTFASDVELSEVASSEPKASCFRSRARERYDDRPFPNVMTREVDGKFYSLSCFEERFGFAVSKLENSASDNQQIAVEAIRSAGVSLPGNVEVFAGNSNDDYQLTTVSSAEGRWNVMTVRHSGFLIAIALAESHPPRGASSGSAN